MLVYICFLNQIETKVTDQKRAIKSYNMTTQTINNHHKSGLKLTCRHINRRHICFNIKSISVHPLLWMNVMLDFICMVFAGM